MNIQEWKNYLQSDKRMLFHETTLPLKGEFRDGTMSTSLIENDHIQRENNKINMLKSTRQKSNFRDDIKIHESDGVKLLKSVKEKIAREVNIGKETEKDNNEIRR